MNAENFHIEEKLRLNKEIDKLKSQLKKVTDQRRPLLKQLDKTENRVSQLDAFHKRIIPALVQFGLTSENKDIHGHLWISMDIHEISMDMHRNPWMSLDIHGSCMDISGYTWISMDVIGYVMYG